MGVLVAVVRGWGRVGAVVVVVGYCVGDDCGFGVVGGGRLWGWW